MPERIRLRTAELRAALDFCHTALAGGLVLLCIHFDVGLRIAARGMDLKEGAIAAVEDVDFGVGELRVVVLVYGTVALANKFCPESC